MRYRFRYFAGFVLLLFTGTSLYGQDLILGLQYSRWNQTFNRYSDNYTTSNYSADQAGITIEFSPYFSYLFISSGIEYAKGDLSEDLYIPLSVRIAPGKKVRPFIEGGAYYSLVLNDIEDVYTVQNDIGVLSRLGILVVLNKRWRIEAGYNYNFGLTPALSEETPLPLDQVAIEEYRRLQRGLYARVKYRF